MFRLHRVFCLCACLTFCTCPPRLYLAYYYTNDTDTASGPGRSHSRVFDTYLSYGFIDTVGARHRHEAQQ